MRQRRGNAGEMQNGRKNKPPSIHARCSGPPSGLLELPIAVSRTHVFSGFRLLDGHQEHFFVPSAPWVHIFASRVVEKDGFQMQ